MELVAVWLVLAVIAYAVAARQPRRRWIPTRVIAVLSGAGLVSATVSGPMAWIDESIGQAVGTVVLGLSITGAGWAIGRAVWDRRAYTARNAEQFAARAVAEERLRIARDLHDAVAHSMSVITVKAGVAAHVAETRPAEVPDALRVIEQTGRTALAEMRQLLDVLRSEGAPVDPDAVPGVAQLGALKERAVAAGVIVELDLDNVERLPEGVSGSTYRIVQEAVTNVMKHAAPAHCRVMITAGPEDVWIHVSDDGPGPTGVTGVGHGLIGMRERVAMYGGEFSAGPGPDGGFAVSARLPYRSAS